MCVFNFWGVNCPFKPFVFVRGGGGLSSSLRFSTICPPPPGVSLTSIHLLPLKTVSARRLPAILPPYWISPQRFDSAGRHSRMLNIANLYKKLLLSLAGGATGHTVVLWKNFFLFFFFLSVFNSITDVIKCKHTLPLLIYDILFLVFGKILIWYTGFDTWETHKLSNVLIDILCTFTESLLITSHIKTYPKSATILYKWLSAGPKSEKNWLSAFDSWCEVPLL